ncbi:MAG: UDP-glucose 4-epimerase GalE [Candidatus Auribacterota bacterium]|jgi:UDP-glucose 4-epimerase|nr:UDP-glucose 4-epimerase GalE [Candidatus Auribacterota bacterium]
MAVLITGGAGYIGSHVVYEFLDSGHEIIVVDDLSTGVRELLPADIRFYQGNISDVDLVEEILSDHKIDTVLHFAGSIVVPESVENPLKYYQNNTCVSLSLLQSCVKHGVKNFIFSSTASVYGNNPLRLMKEDYLPQPENPYAASKLMTEMMIKDTAKAHGLNFAILRYFNVAGADPKGRTGQVKENATHLIKVACETALGRRASMKIYGTDYDTPDGTCIRDYIHVSDLANAHLRVYERMMKGVIVNRIYNCGYGQGFTVLDVLKAVENVSGTSIHTVATDRRVGDPVALIADSNLLKTETGWKPAHFDLEVMIKTVLNWEKFYQR